MENKKTAKVMIIGIIIYMLLSWFIKAGNFNETEFVVNGYNIFGLFDILLAPLNVFNFFVYSMTKNIDGLVNTVSFFNIILAFITIGLYYGVLNKTGAYQGLVNKLSKKLTNKKGLVLILVGVLYYVISSLTGLNLVLFFILPFFVALLMKLKYNRQTVFTATIGSMLIGRVSCLFDSNINGLNRIIAGADIIDSFASRIILFVMVLVLIIATLLLTNDKEVKKVEDIPLFDKDVKENNNTLPIIIITSIITLVLMVCMYNWYYMFNTTKVTDAYNSIISTKIGGYEIMKNVFGMSESFGYWTGFTMSGLLLVGSLVIKFLYNIKFDNYVEGMKKGFIDMIPTAVLSIISLTIIVISLNNSDSFIYNIINIIFDKVSIQSIGIYLSTFLHSFFINDYFATTSLLQAPLSNIYGAESDTLVTFITQITNGITSLISPFSIYLIAGLSFMKVSYTSWIKYIWKTLLILLIISCAVVVVTVSFI